MTNATTAAARCPLRRQPDVQHDQQRHSGTAMCNGASSSTVDCRISSR